LSSCGSSSQTTTIVRDVDAIQVMTPEEVTAMRSTLVPVGDGSDNSGTTDESTAGEDASNTTSDTIPLNKDDRPPELKLFDAFSKFSGCIKDSGETIRGDLQDPNNPAYQDPAYLEVVQKCAARSDIVNILNEVSTTRANLTPDEIKTRNEAFVVLSDCLKKKGWKIDTSIDSSGLINPTTFQSADGDLNQRDLDSCLTETGINDAIENGA
jgi:hypothetical protein